MPELPEVEIIKRQLSNSITDLKINKIFQSFLTFRGKEQPQLLCLVNEKILNIHRRNKYIVIDLDNHYLIIHLGMTGQLVYTNKDFDDIIKIKHIHMAMKLSSGTLYYHDVRRFGGINIYSKSNYNNYLDIPLFKKIGIEPLSENFTYEKLYSLVKKSKEEAKQFLMNGENICGIGNIYANEILFLTKIHPKEKINSLTDEQIKQVFKHIKSVLQKAIELGGSSISDFIHINGLKGEMQNFYTVYGRQGKPCIECSDIVIKIKQHGRSSFYCPCCQKSNNIVKT